MKLEIFNKYEYDLNKMTDEQKNNLLNTLNKILPKENVIGWLKNLKNNRLYLIEYLDLSKNKYETIGIRNRNDKLIEYFENNKVAIYYIADMG